MKNFFIIIIVLLTSNLKAQVQEDFYYFFDKSFNTLYNNPDDCITFCQSLVINDKEFSNKMVYQNIISQSYNLKGDYLNSVKSVLAKNDLKNYKDTQFQHLFLNYSLADQYQNLGLYSQSRKVIDNILNEKNSKTYKGFYGKIYQLQALNFAVNKEYSNALALLNTSNKLLTNKTQEHNILRIENELFKGVIFCNQKKIVEAETIFNSVLKNRTLDKYDFLYALARENASRTYFLKQNNDKAIQLLKEALEKINSKDYKQLKSKIYDGLAKIYLLQKKEKEYKYYNDLYNKTKNELDKNKKSAINYLVTIIENIENEKIIYLKENNKKRLLLITSTSIFLLIILGSLFLFSNKRKKEIAKQITFFENFKNRNQPVVIIPQPISEETDKKVAMLSEEKEKELLEKLEHFENSQLYLSNQMSLPLLASELNTNIKYLSEIIRKFKCKNFNGYINDLRIQYIVRTLKTDANYLNYKVSYLAEISGFSSHSAFATVFKNVTGMSPNDFIRKISESKK